MGKATFKDLFGKALYSFYVGASPSFLILRNNYGDPEDMPVDVFFRKEDEMDDLELYAISLCKGRILDVGAGAGCHSVLLQSRGFDVTALEKSPLCAQLIKNQEVEKVIEGDIFQLESEEKFDTILLLMNGLGLAGSWDGLEKLMEKLHSLLAPGGQILCDSSDVTYLYESEPKPKGEVFGQVKFRYEFLGEKDPWFDWIYFRQEDIVPFLEKKAWSAQVVFEDDNDQFLLRLTR